MDWPALAVSLRLGLGTILILLPFGVWLGRFLAAHTFRGKLLVESLVTVPLVLPPTVLGFYLLVTFGARSPIGQAFQALAGSPAVLVRRPAAGVGHRQCAVRRPAHPAWLRGDPA
jgi:molybdate transport system permease protein